MGKYIVKRLLMAIPVFLVMTFALFILSDMMPGSAIDVIMMESQLSVEAQAALEHQLGLDKPVVIRYILWLKDMLSGNMGVSVVTKNTVASMIAVRVGPTLMLTLTGIGLAILVSIPLGVLSAYRPYSVIDNISSVLAFIGSSAPSFFISLSAVYIFAVKLKLLPAQGMYTAGVKTTFSDLLRHLILPATVIAFQSMGNLVKQTRGSVLEVLGEDYIKTARSKGIREKMVIICHALRNALIPIVTTISLSLPFVIGGSVVVETIFSWPGLGSLMIASITNRDYPPLMGVAVVICIVVLVFNILLDLIYSLLDPRISYDK